MSGAIDSVSLIGGAKQNVSSETSIAPVPALDFSRRIPELDGLRGIAIGMVVYTHYVWMAIPARPPELLGYFYASQRMLWSAVDLFFLLSGFLIGGNLLDARESPNYFRTFYIRRFCRVLPIYYLCVVLAAIAFHYFYLPVGAPLDWVFAERMPWPSYVFFTQNIWMTKLNTIGAPMLGVTWAFAIEVQFYFVVPLIIRFVKRSVLPYVFMAGIAVAPLVRLCIALRFRTNLWATYVLLPSRMDSLFLGLLCAYWVREPAIWNWIVKRRKFLWLAFFVLIAGMPALNSEGIPFTFLWISAGYGWMSFFFATVLLLVLTDRQSLFNRIMRWRCLTEFGTISYGVYLFHVGIYSFCLWKLTGHGWPPRSLKDCGASLLAFAITIVSAELSWRYLEKPMVRWGHKWLY